MENIEHFKTLLEKELATVEGELATVGRKNPSNPADWEPVEPDSDRDRADETEVADTIEELDNNTAVLDELEQRLREIKKALSKIDDGTYGTCEIGGEPIETDRLEANPAATTCTVHMG